MPHTKQVKKKNCAEKEMAFYKDLPDYFKQFEIQFILDTSKHIDPKKILYQTGGKSKSKTIISFDADGVFTFDLNINYTDDLTSIHVINDAALDCSSVAIYKGQSTASLNNLSYDKTCAREGLKKPGGGSVLLRFVLNHLSEHKEELKINKVVLTDISYIPCPAADENIKLSNLRMVTRGQPWYMRYRFRPYDKYTGKPSKSDMLEIIENDNKLKTLKLSDINIEQVVKKVVRKGIIKMDDIKKLFSKHKLVRDLIIDMRNDLQKYCEVIQLLLVELFEKTKENKYKPPLHNLHGKMYYLDL